MAYILENSNWFYLYGVIFIIRTISGVVNNCKNFTGIKPQSTISNLFFYISLLWLIVGIVNHERMLFVVLFVSSVIVPVLLHLGDYKKMFTDVVDNRGDVSVNQKDIIEKYIDVENLKKHRRFHAVAGILEVFIIVAILVNHFKFDIFYLTL